MTNVVIKRTIYDYLKCVYTASGFKCTDERTRSVDFVYDVCGFNK